MKSLRVKLIVGSLLVLSAVILSFDVFIFVAKRGALLDVLDNRLFAESQAIARRVEISGGKPSYDAADDPGPGSGFASLVRIVAENEAVIYQTPGSAALVWPPAANIAESPSWKTIRSASGAAWRTVTWADRLEAEAESGGKKAAPAESTVTVAIQCAASLGEIKEELGELAALLAVLSAAAFLIAGGGSLLLAGRALRPIRRIDKALAEVSETRLDRRIDPDEFDRELHPLIGQLNAALDRLDKGFRRERQFTADASHELRTPLAALLNNIEVLLRRPRSEPELIEAHRDNWRTARSMQAIIEGLLLLARMDAGKASPVKEEIPLLGLVDGILASFGPQAEAGNIRLERTVEPGLRIPADPAQIRLALSNLIDNAIRYNRSNGRVTVEARTVADGTVIEVKDTGIGIPAEHLSRIFERFYRVDSSRAEGTGGSGLGLSIVRRIVEAHGGRVTAAGGPEGTVISVFLPGL